MFSDYLDIIKIGEGQVKFLQKLMLSGGKGLAWDYSKEVSEIMVCVEAKPNILLIHYQTRRYQIFGKDLVFNSELL